MDKQELIAIYHLLRHQEEKLYELHRGLRAVVHTLNSQHSFREAYPANYSDVGSSEVALGYAPTLKAIDETILRLKENVS